jgi:very-short-patch-repair endonuclease
MKVASVRVGREVARLAERQWSVASRTQLTGCGLSDDRLARWVREWRLVRLHPGVYGVGSSPLRPEGHLLAALLYSGPGAALSHTTAAGWWELIGGYETWIHVTTPSRHRARPGLRLHRAKPERVGHRGLPVTPVPRTLLDSAALIPFAQLRRALAEAEYRRLVDRDQLLNWLGRGRRGSAALRRAIELHSPDLARTLSQLEERFLALCEKYGVPSPQVNRKVCGLMVDALWPEQRLVVELDGARAHATPAAMERDRDRDLTLRAAGFEILRYTWHQVTQQPDAVVADLRRALAII